MIGALDWYFKILSCRMWLSRYNALYSTDCIGYVIPNRRAKIGDKKIVILVGYSTILTGKFQKFDFGRGKNLKLYGTATPPKYNLTNIRIKVHLLYGSNDNLVSELV